MGLFRRKEPDPERELAAAIGKRGLAAEAAIESVRPTGATRDGGGHELELVLDFATREGAPVRARVRQFFNHVTARGLEAGARAEIMYDRENPQAVVVMGPAR